MRASCTPLLYSFFVLVLVPTYRSIAPSLFDSHSRPTSLTRFLAYPSLLFVISWSFIFCSSSIRFVISIHLSIVQSKTSCDIPLLPSPFLDISFVSYLSFYCIIPRDDHWFIVFFSPFCSSYLLLFIYRSYLSIGNDLRLS